MDLSAVAQLLATALVLLQAVNANPALPQAVRDSAQSVAESAITEATRAMGQTSAGAPSCKIVSDKYNYRVGEVVVFDYVAKNVTKFEFVQNPKGHDEFPVPEGELLSMSGQYRKVVEVSGYPFFTMKATNATGQSATCSAMVNVHEK